MTATIWSPNLKNVISTLAKLQPLKRKTLLNDQKFMQNSKLSIEEKKIINGVYLKSEQNVNTLGIWQ